MQFNDYEVLQNVGKVSAAIAKRLAEKEYDKFAPIQDRDYISDFDREVKKMEEKVNKKSRQ